jgi:hypothetical protein
MVRRSIGVLHASRSASRERVPQWEPAAREQAPRVFTRNEKARKDLAVQTGFRNSGGDATRKSLSAEDRRYGSSLRGSAFQVIAGEGSDVRMFSVVV